MKRKHFGTFFICAVAQALRDQGESAPDHCQPHLSRQAVKWFRGEPYCHACLLKEMREYRLWQKERHRTLAEKREALTDQESAELLKLEARILRQKTRRREYDRKYRRGELSWQRRPAA